MLADWNNVQQTDISDTHEHSVPLYFQYPISLCRGVATGVTKGASPPHFNFWTKKGPTVAVSNIRGIAFYGCSEIIWTGNFAIFTVYATTFGQYTALNRGNRSLLVGISVNVRCLTLNAGPSKEILLWNI